ncbi:MAG: hypothetical protein AAB969_01265, partial [Patescibacteria group bacterium]
TIMPAFFSGIKDAGCQIFYLGINSTPTMFFAIKDKKLDGGISLTASHNPIGYTGLKLCNKNGSLLGLNTGVKKIQQLAEKIIPPKTEGFKSVKTTPIDIANHYYQFASKIAELKKISGFKIILDASGGSGTRLADYFFARLHSKIIKINFKPNDRFIDHGPNPMLAKNQKSAIEAIKKYRADLAIIFDGDGDRCIFIDENGKFINPYYINCLLSEIILKKYKKTVIAIDARLQLGLSEVIKKSGGTPIVSRSGYANLVDLMRNRKTLFGCENSGHYFFNFRIIDKKNNYIFGDSIIPILLILEHLKENNLSLSEAIDEFKNKYFISGELNYENVNFSTLEKKLVKKYAGYKKDNLDGLSIYGHNWFMNIRPSKTEPIVRLNVEAKNKATLDKITKEIISLIK